ncbi:MAG: hypothetical protein SGILL_006931, partial [Bacillariaceae sp.]
MKESRLSALQCPSLSVISISSPTAAARHSFSSRTYSSRKSWFHFLVRCLPFFLITTTCTTTPLSLKGSGPGGIINLLDTTFGKKTHNGGKNTDHSNHNLQNRQILLDPDTTKNQLEKRTTFIDKKKLLEKKNSVNDSNNSSSDDEEKNTKKKVKMMRLPTGEQLSEEDQKFLERVQNSLKTVQHWDADTKLFEKVRNEIIPWDDLRDNDGPYSKSEDRLFVQSNALFLQRLCRWFPTIMSWVNAPPCVKCGCKECEMKTVRGPETSEEKEGGAKRVE